MFEIAIEPSRSAIPPLICLEGLGRVWRFIIIAPSTTARPFSRSTSSTRPVLPLSRPEITITWSSLRILIFAPGVMPWCRSAFAAVPRLAVLRAMLEHLRRKRNDLHIPLVAQLASHRSEHARSHRLAHFVD